MPTGNTSCFRAKRQKNHANLDFPRPGNGLFQRSQYGPYIIHRFTKAVDGKCRIFYTLSTWNPYQVMIMQTDLKVPER
jgi:hypothetical protein